MQGLHNVLFVRTGSSARSLLAEASAHHFGCGRFDGYSAGSEMNGPMYSKALQVLQDVDGCARRDS